MSDFEKEFDEWRAKSYEWYKKKRAEGLSDEQALELFWGKETLKAIRSGKPIVENIVEKLDNHG